MILRVIQRISEAARKRLALSGSPVKAIEMIEIEVPPEIAGHPAVECDADDDGGELYLDTYRAAKWVVWHGDISVYKTLSGFRVARMGCIPSGEVDEVIRTADEVAAFLDALSTEEERAAEAR